MLPKQNRYTTPEFDQVFKNNTAIHGDYLIRLKPTDKIINTNPSFSKKSAVIVSKKNYRRRVDRNRIRRFVYRIIQEHLNTEFGGIYLLKKDQGNFLDLIKNNPDQAKQQITNLVTSQKI